MSRNVESIFGAVVTAPHQIPYTYTATGGETFISLPFYPVTGFITINGGVQVPVDNYVIDGNTVNLGRALEAGDVVYCLFDKILSPEDYENGIRIYKFQAVGNETTFTPDFTTYGVQNLYVDGKYQVPDVNYAYSQSTGVVEFLTGSPAAGVWVVAEMSVKQPNISPLFDRTIQEVARSAKVKDADVVFGVTGASLSSKKVIYDKVAERWYSLPTGLTSTVVSLVDGVLTHSNGSVDLGALAVTRDEYVTLPGSFTSGQTIRVKNEILVHNGESYIWQGALPKTVPQNSTPATSGGVSSTAWKNLETLLMKLPLSAAIERAINVRFMDLRNVKDLGAKGDGSTDDTAAIQAVIDSLSPAGGVVYLPSGRYKITDDLKVNNMPIVFKGDGMYSSVIEQNTTNKNGITFTSTTSGNYPSTDSLLINSIQIQDMSVNRGAGTGGYAVAASWAIMTSNSPQAMFERFRIYSKSDAANCWTGGLELRNCNGLRINTVQIHGNPNETPLTASDPYTLRFGIRLSNDSSNALGLISFFIDKLTVIAAGVGIDVFGWHEGVEICNSEIVQVALGIRVQGDSVHKNPDFFYLNSHIEARVKAVTMSNVFKAKFTGCDLFHSSAVGYSGAVIELNGCDGFSATGCAISMQRGTATYTVTGIVAAGSYHGNVSGCTFIGFDSGIDINSDYWIVGDNVFYLNTFPMRLYGNNHTIGVNKYTNCTNDVQYIGTGHQVTPIQYITQANMVVGTTGTTQGFTVTIPSGIFKNAPGIGMAQLVGASTTLMVSISYNRSSSTSTSAKFEVTGSVSIPTGTYVFSVLLQSNP